ncbi:MAG: hypothetical protein AB7G23_20260 [Vicinamibacterales bacterium]
MAADLKFDVSALDRASATFAKLGKTVERFERKLDQLDGKRIEAEVKVKVDDANLRKLDKGLGDSVIHIAALGKALKAIAIPASVVAAAPQLASLGAAAVSASGAVGLLPAAGAAAAAVFATLKLGTQGLGDAFKAAASGDAKALAEALKNLSPAARDLVLAVRDIGPAWKTLQLDVQEKLLAGLGTELRKLSGTYLPVLQRGLTGIASALNDGARALSAWALQSSTVQAIARILDNTTTAMQRLSPAAANVAAALTDIADVGSEFLPGLASGITGATERFREFVAAARESGELRAWIQGGIDTLGELWQITKNVASALGGLFDAAELGGVDVLGALERATRGLAEAINSIEGQQDIATVFREISETMTALWRASEPVRDVLSTLASTVLPALLQILQWIAPVLVPIVSGLVALRLAAAGLARLQALPQWLGTTTTQAAGTSTALRQLRDELRLQQALALAAGQSVGVFGAALGLAQGRMGRFMAEARDGASGFHNLARSTDALGERLATTIPQAAERAGVALQGALGRAVTATTSTLARGFDAVGAGASKLGQSLQRVGQAASDAIGRIASTPIENRLLAGFQRVSAAMDKSADVAIAGYQRIAQGMDKAGDAMVAGWAAVGRAVDKGGDALVSAYGGVVKATDALGDGLVAAYRGISTAMDKAGDGLVAGWQKTGAAMDAAGDALVAGFRGISTAMDSAGNAMVASYTRITAGVDAIGNAFARIRDVPQLVTTGLQTGLTNAATAAASAGERISQVATNIGTTIRGIGTAASSVDVAGVFTRMGTAVGSAAEGIAGGLSRAMAAMGTFSHAVGALSTTIGSGLMRAGSSLVGFLGGPWGVAFAAATVALGAFASKQAEAAQKTAEAKQALEQQRTTLDQVSGAVTQATVNQKALELSQQGLLDKAQALSISTKDYTQASLGNADALKRVQTQLDAHIGSVIAASPAYRTSSLEIQNMGLSLQDLTAAAQGNPAALAKVDEAVRRASGGSQEAQTHLRMVADALIAAGGPAAELGRQLMEANGGLARNVEVTRDAAEASGALQLQLQGVQQAFAAVPDQKVVTLEASSISGVRQQLIDMGFQIRDLPDGRVEITAPTDQAKAQLDGFVAQATGVVVTIPIHGNPTPVNDVFAAALTTINSGQGTVTINGQTMPLQAVLTSALEQVNAGVGTVTINGQSVPARDVLTALIAAVDAGQGTVTINGQTVPADQALQALVGRADSSTGTVTVDADTSPAEAKLRAFLAQKPVITVGTRLTGPAAGSVGGGSGGFVAGYSGGGVVGSPKGYAGGGIIPGYRPGVDDIPAMLSRGEAVLVPELVRRIGADNIMRANREASGGRPATVVGRVPSGMRHGSLPSGGGMVRGASPVVLPSSGSPDVVAAVRGLRGELAAVREAVRSARPITVEDRSGDPTATARMTQLALRLA